MALTEHDKNIIKRIRIIIAEEGLSNKLDVYPIENVCTRHPRYWNDGNINLFKIHLWTVNKLSDDRLEDTLHFFVDIAKRHFNL